MTTTHIIILCLIVAASIVYVYDFVGFPRQFVARLYTIFTGKEITLDRIKLPKLVECSLCATQWSTLILLAIFNWKLIPLSFVFGWSTKHILTLFSIIDNIFTNILDKIIKVTVKY